MMLYSKDGSIPQPETDGTDGWIEVPEPPTAGDGQEVVWWFPPGWVVRPVKPVKEGFDYNWSQSGECWTEFPVGPTPDPTPDPSPSPSLTDTITLGTAGTTISV